MQPHESKEETIYYKKRGHQIDIIIWATRSKSGNYNEDVEYEMLEEYPISSWYANEEDLAITSEMLISAISLLSEKIPSMSKGGKRAFNNMVRGILEFNEKYGKE